MAVSSSFDLRDHLRDVSDFPKPGIVFKDITPLLKHPGAFRATIDQLAERVAKYRPDVIAAAEARGFLFATPLALAMNLGFVPIRKPGKLPAETVTQEYDLEYGTDRLEIHRDAVIPGQRVLLLDDVLATGGTMRACCDLVAREAAEVVACAFVIELEFLKGRDKLKGFAVESLVAF